MSFLRHGVLAFIVVNTISTQVSANQKHQFSLGGSAGVSTYKPNISANGLVQNVDTVLLNKKADIRGYRLGAFAEYLCRLKQIGIGMEIFGDYGPGETTIQTKGFDIAGAGDVSFALTHSTRYKYGLKAKVGYYFKEDLFVYGTAGFGFQSLKFKQATTRSDDAGAGIMHTVDATISKRIPGFLWGAGITKEVAPHISLGLEGTILHMPQRTLTFSKHPTVPAGAARNFNESIDTTVRVKGTTYTATFRVAYKI